MCKVFMKHKLIICYDLYPIAKAPSLYTDNSLKSGVGAEQYLEHLVCQALWMKDTQQVHILEHHHPLN